VNIIKKICKENEWIYFLFIFIFISIFILFHKAFEINFILDDFIFLKLGKLQSINDFFHVFSPFKTFFYRPIPTEIFYYFINRTGNNIFISHLLVFFGYCVGVFFLYKCIEIITKGRNLSLFITFLYAIHFSHVFQLYELATFIEVSLFLFCTMATYHFLTKKYIPSLVFFYLRTSFKRKLTFFTAIFYLPTLF